MPCPSEIRSESLVTFIKIFWISFVELESLKAAEYNTETESCVFFKSFFA